MSNLPVEPEFEQAYNELASTLENSTLFQKNPEYRKGLQVVSIPERIIQFRVVWEDDNGDLQVNRGYRVQFNSALGPYKGGLRFHPSVNLSILKFLGFEQIFKNALTGLNMGGAKGGADFDPKGKSDNEIRRFCVAFMTELCKHIGADTDVPAGDIGVSGREIGYLFGQYKKIRNRWEGVLTGKGTTWGGSLIRPEATGYGVVYYVQHMIQYATSGQGTLRGKRIAISGSGNVAQYAALKAIELGASVISMSDSQGALLITGSEGDSFTSEEIHHIAKVKWDRKQLASLFDTDTTTDAKNPFKNNGKFKYIPNARPWTNFREEKVDIALPCATQNEISGSEARALLASGCQYVVEGSNMGCTQEAIDIFEHVRESSPGPSSSQSQGTDQGHPEGMVWYAPGKAANAGGVAVSGLEMAQNSTRLSWSAEEVDERLKGIMRGCFADGVRMALEYTPSTTSPATSTEEKKRVLPSLVAGSNIAGFIKVVAAMKEQGDWW